jgi:hypothetical protein
LNVFVDNHFISFIAPFLVTLITTLYPCTSCRSVAIPVLLTHSLSTKHHITNIGIKNCDSTDWYQTTDTIRIWACFTRYYVYVPAPPLAELSLPQRRSHIHIHSLRNTRKSMAAVMVWRRRRVTFTPNHDSDLPRMAVLRPMTKALSMGHIISSIVRPIPRQCRKLPPPQDGRTRIRLLSLQS